MDFALLATSFGAFFAIMNPFITLPFFLSMTAHYSEAEQKRVAIKVVTYSAIMCAVLFGAGQAIIGFFGVSVDDFRVAGGLVVAGVAWSMLNGQRIDSHQGSDKEQAHLARMDAFAFYPLTFPMVVGPGTIATLFIYAANADTNARRLTIVVVIAAVLALMALVLYFASVFGRVLSETMRVIMTRLMGMILLAIAVSMVFTGLKAVFPALQ